MIYLLTILLTAIVLSGCGARNPSSIDISKMQFPSPSPGSTSMPGVPITDESQIKEVLSDALKVQPKDLVVTISANDGVYAAGSSKTANENNTRMWYAVKEKGGWQVVWQGVGTIPCSSLTTISDYPNKLIPECVNEEGKTVKR